MAMLGHGGMLMEGSPYSIPSRKLTMWLFIISDAVTFGVILFAYGYLRVATPDWQSLFNSASIINVATMTFVLITSSLTMVGAVDASEHVYKRKAIRFLRSTLVLCLCFP